MNNIGMKTKQRNNRTRLLFRIAAFAVFLAVTLSLLASTACEPKSLTLAKTIIDATASFNTSSNLALYEGGNTSLSKEDMQKYEAIFLGKIAYYGQLFDAYTPDEDANIVTIYELNERARHEPVSVSADMMEFLLFSKEVYRKTNGKINIALGAVTGIWHEAREAGIKDPENAYLPGTEELTGASEHCDIDSLILDTEACSVFFADPELRLDVGALAKGWAQERIYEALREAGADSFILDMGGAIRLGEGFIGKKPVYFNIGVSDPLAPENLMCRLSMSKDSLSSSGDYFRFFVVDGVRYSHLIDPETLQPAVYHSAVSVVTDNGGMADAYSTYLFLLPLDEAMAFCEREKLQAIFVSPEGETVMTAQFQELLAEFYR